MFLTNQQYIEMMFGPTKGGKVNLHHNTKCHQGQSEDRIVCVSQAMWKCNV